MVTSGRDEAEEHPVGLPERRRGSGLELLDVGAVTVDATSPGLRALALGDDRFFCRDGLLEVWLAMIVDRMSEGPLAPWQQSLTSEWRSQVTVRFSGVMTAELDRYLDRDERRKVLVELCVELRNELANGRHEPGPLARRVLGFSPDSPRRDMGLLRVADSMLWLMGRCPTGEVRPGANGTEVAENTNLW